MKTKVLIAVIALFITTFLVVSSNKSDLTGKIQDYSGAGILFSTLEVYKLGVESQLVYKVITNINGDFELPNLGAGAYKLVIKAEGFEDKVQFVKLSGKDKNLGSIQMDGDIITLNPVVIYGKGV